MSMEEKVLTKDVVEDRFAGGPDFMGQVYHFAKQRNPINDTAIQFVVSFAETIPKEEVIGLLEKSIGTKSEFFSKIIENPKKKGYALWEKISGFAIAENVSEVVLKDDVKDLDKELLTITENLIDKSFPSDKPLWECLIVRSKNFALKTHLVLKVSHSIGDGYWLQKVFYPVLKSADGSELSFGRTKNVIDRTQGLTFWQRILRSVLKFLGYMAILMSLIMPHFNRGFWIFKKDKVSKERLVPKRRIVRSEPFEFTRIRSSAKKVGATPNELMTTAVTIAWRKYALEVEGAKSVPDMPITLATRANTFAESNNGGIPLIIDLPTSATTSKAALSRVKWTMGFLKSTEMVYTYLEKFAGLLTAMLPDEFSKSFDDFTLRTTAALTNVASFPTPVSLGKYEIKDFFAAVPMSNAIGCQIFLCYKGFYRAILLTNEKIVSRPERFMQLFNEEMKIFLTE